MQVEFRVFRQLPPAPPTLQSYMLEVDPGSTILDCLTRIKWEHDGSLAFRKNCRNMICGSCAMRVNGRATLACKQHVSEEVGSDCQITIAPLGNLPVVKDLIVDMANFWDSYQQVDPYVSTAARRIPEREFLQSPQERARLTQASNCILCGACYSDCNAREVNPEFVGPHALAKANRLIQDSRDDNRQSRLEQHNHTAGVWGCTRCLNCNAVCPMGVAPLDQISQIKQQILATYPVRPITASRAVRHRKALIELVRAGGWIDERKFGFRVVGNDGRDLAGLLSLVPLGSRMVAKRKFPLRFHRSRGCQEVQNLIDAVRTTKEPIPSDINLSDTPLRG